MAAAAVVLMPVATWALGELAVELAGWAMRPGAGVDAILAPAIVGLGAAVCGYLTLSALVMVAAALSGSVPDRVAAIAPLTWRRIVATAAGVTLSTGLAVPALASDIAPGWSVAVSTAGVDAAPGWTSSGASRPGTDTATDAFPGWIDPPLATAVAEAPASEADSAPRTRTVVSGDSLWAITADLIGDQDPERVAAAWPVLYKANRDVIGDDPSLLLPGQVLDVPSELAR